MNGRAVVIGGSMAGLGVARVLADFFAEVMIVEREDLPDGALARQGTPQARQIHVLLARGGRILGELFPGLFRDLTAEGAVQIDAGEIRWFHNRFWRCQLQTGITTYSLTRPLLEWKVRSHVSVHPRVAIQTKAPVTGLMWDSGRNRVTGVKTESGESLAADLVVDASGRGSRVPQWLEEAGYPPVPVSTLKVDIGYATRVYRRPPGERDWKALLVNAAADQKRAAGIFPVEGDRWLVTLQGYGDQRPPADPEAFLAAARSLPVPDIYEAMRYGEPLGPIIPYRYPGYQRRHFERVARNPEGLVVLGDASCSFNPVYGQGMTTALLGAMALGDCLRRQDGSLVGLPRRFYSRLAPLLDVPWRMATLEDYGIVETTDRKPAGTGMMQWYTQRVHNLTAHDRDVMLRFLQVMHMVKPPAALFSPRTIWQVVTK